MPTYKKPEDAENGLHVLLLRAVPVNDLGNKTLTELAKKLHLSKWAVRKWINNKKIPPDRAAQIVKISEGRVKLEDFHPYVYKD
ncbi:Cro/Cl family transcriptional regulator [Synechococcus virus S-ESS1]|uniref:Cro/Cl family transcriptional regulator n=1 Tax=Synechococcus virus S-ESS1 TaxID=1964565 RepID=A0A1V0DX64_9CAUD|nr:transcriptional repressor [Synechococcus virus S-ESS1]ARB05731.1 Cro/Cl family transcriptional regulator [Synechococcus virus S-ESS1]